MILGLHIGHDATACLIGKSVTAIAEERVSRIKNHTGFPFGAIEHCLTVQGSTWNDLRSIIVAGSGIADMASYRSKMFFLGKQADFSNEVSWSTRYDMFRYKANTRTLHDFLSDYAKEQGFTGTISYEDHHLAHVASSYAVYPRHETVLFSLDGGGDGINWSLYLSESGEFKPLAKSSPMAGRMSESPADVYANTTKLLGFKRVRHEGKLTGLAAQGTPDKKSYFHELMNFQEGQFVQKTYPRPSLARRLKRHLNLPLFGICYNMEMLDDMRDNLRDVDRETVASSLQTWFEESILSLLDYYVKELKLGGRQLLLSGGAFANVLLNQRIHETGMFSNVSVVPNMGDGGLALGAAYLGCSPEERKSHFPEEWTNVYCGPQYSRETLIQAALDSGLSFVELKDKAPEVTAKALEQELIVGLFTAGMEFGPRALGARSILANPSDSKINETINNRLNRTEFMPFAPCILDVNADKCLIGYSDTHVTARFMTITYNVRDIMKEKAPAVVHVDGTARPQIIERSQNRLYYDIVNEFWLLTGIPAVVNTSFNAHEEPIVMSPKNAISSYKAGAIDLLLLDDIMIGNKDLLDSLTA